MKTKRNTTEGELKAAIRWLRRRDPELCSRLFLDYRNGVLTEDELVDNIIGWSESLSMMDDFNENMMAIGKE